MMKQKFTVLSLASLLALAPLSSALAQTNETTAGPAATSTEASTEASTETSTSTEASTEASVSAGASSQTSTEQSGDTDTNSNSQDDDGYDSESSSRDAEDYETDSEDSGKDSGAREDDLEDLGDAYEELYAELINGDIDLEDVTELIQNIKDLRSKLNGEPFARFLEKQEAENQLFVLDQDADYTVVISDLQQQLESDPENSDLYVKLALTYLATGDVTQAEELSKQLDALAPDSYLSFLVQAEVAGSKGDVEEKQLLLEKALEQNPASSVTQYKLGVVLAEAGQYDKAVAHLSMAATLNPKNPEIFEQLNNVFVQTENHELKTYVNGVVPEFNVQPFIENGRTLMPVRAISESLGADVEWNGAEQQVSIQRGDTTIQLTIDSHIALVNGQEVTLDVPAKVVDGSTVLPLRFVSESLGTTVEWKAESQMIIISE